MLIRKPAHLVTIKDIASLLNMSHSTVSRALNDRSSISEATKTRVRQAADELGYVANLSARMIRGDAAPVVGLIIPDVRNDFYSNISRMANVGGERHSSPRTLATLSSMWLVVIVAVGLVRPPFLGVVMMADSTANCRSRDPVMASHMPDKTAGDGTRNTSGLRVGDDAQHKSRRDYDELEHGLRPQWFVRDYVNSAGYERFPEPPRTTARARGCETAGLEGDGNL